jgi:6-phosphogluconolactonase/glucosamine-6-phosphate isomerase/deaminase
MSAVSVTPGLLAQVDELLFLVAGGGKQKALQALEAHAATLTAWRAVQGRSGVELWTAVTG